MTFAWIAINPQVNASAWLRWDRCGKKKAHNDWDQHLKETLLTAETLAEFDAFIAAGPAMPSNLAQRAEEVDRHWTISPDTPLMTFRGLYAIIYRAESQAVHAAPGSLVPLIVGVGPARFQVRAGEADPGERSPFTRAPYIYGLMLLIAEHVLDEIVGVESELDRVFAA